jgi:predicted GNAT family acetyltransferase
VSFTLRRATHDDWQVYREIRLRALAEAPDAYGSTVEHESDFDESTWRSRTGDSYLLFAMLDGRVVATATAIPDRHEAGGQEIVGMWVDPDARGLGIAASLVQALADRAAVDGAPSIALWVADGNDVARRVYERCGFVATGQREPLRPGLGEERMRRSLV